MILKTVEGNTGSSKGLVANGGCVAQKDYSSSYSRIAVIYRPKYLIGEADKVVAEALKYVGYLEKKSNKSLEDFKANAGSNNYNMFAPHAKGETGSSVYQNGVAWCDIFVDDMFIRAFGAKRAKVLLGDWSAYTPTSAAFLQRAGAEVISPAMAKYGDIIFFKNSSRICHVGIITNYYSNPAKDNDKLIYSHDEFVADVCKTLKVSNAKKAWSKTITLSEKYNNTNILVLYVQKRLQDLGYYKGIPDREFGPLTIEAVNAYQKKVLGYKNPDGEITRKGFMWKTLLGL